MRQIEKNNNNNNSSNSLLWPMAADINIQLNQLVTLRNLLYPIEPNLNYHTKVGGIDGKLKPGCAWGW